MKWGGKGKQIYPPQNRRKKSSNVAKLLGRPWVPLASGSPLSIPGSRTCAEGGCSPARLPLPQASGLDPPPASPSIPSLSPRGLADWMSSKGAVGVSCWFALSPPVPCGEPWKADSSKEPSKLHETEAARWTSKREGTTAGAPARFPSVLRAGWGCPQRYQKPAPPTPDGVPFCSSISLVDSWLCPKP